MPVAERPRSSVPFLEMSFMVALLELAATTRLRRLVKRPLGNSGIS